MIRYDCMTLKFKVRVKINDNDSTRMYTVANIVKLLAIEHNQTRKDTIANDPGLVKIANGECDVFINDECEPISDSSAEYKLITQWFGSLLVEPVDSSE